MLILLEEKKTPKGYDTDVQEMSVSYISLVVKFAC